MRHAVPNWGPGTRHQPRWRRSTALTAPGAADSVFCSASARACTVLSGRMLPLTPLTPRGASSLEPAARKGRADLLPDAASSLHACWSAAMMVLWWWCSVWSAKLLEPGSSGRPMRTPTHPCTKRPAVRGAEELRSSSKQPAPAPAPATIHIVPQLPARTAADPLRCPVAHSHCVACTAPALPAHRTLRFTQIEHHTRSHAVPALRAAPGRRPAAGAAVPQMGLLHRLAPASRCRRYGDGGARPGLCLVHPCPGVQQRATAGRAAAQEDRQPVW